MKIGFRIFLILLLWPFLICGQSDSTIHKPIQNAWYQTRIVKTLTVPAVLIGYGLSCTGTHGIYSSYQFESFLQKDFSGFHTHIDDYLAFSPAALAIGLKLGGIKTEHNLWEGAILYIVSAGLTEGITEGLKYATHEQRPDRSDYLSFPSGHTSFAFQGAEFMHQEYINQSAWYSVSGYTMAAATGILRMLNDKHWLNDVLVGAGVGILTTRFVYLVYPSIKRNLLHRRKVKALVF